MASPRHSTEDDATASTFKFLITTDNHLGFAERDPRRGDDSFTTFEEILRAARIEHDVDAMLLGGDLYHESKPSLGCLTRSCSLFRKYVLGDRPIAVTLLSDASRNFPTHALPLVNYADPNINVALPIFAIHGNHDDPVGGTSALDVLATNGYINYFGLVASLDDIVVEPVLLRKGHTFVALYGLGNVRNERLHRCFRSNKVHFVYPKPVAGRRWFNILMLHQSRGVRGTTSKGGIYESMLAGLRMDLVIWGDEHEQLMLPQPSNGFDVVQPGSTILTSLSAQECNPKQYGILEVRGTSYRLTPFPLRSVRPVVRRTVELRRDLPHGRTLDAVETYLHRLVEDMIGEAEKQVHRIPDDVLAFHPQLKYPLMRLAVDFSDPESAPFPTPNLNRFGQHYMDVVANPESLLQIIRPKPARATVGAAVGGGQGGNAVVPLAPQLSTLDIRTKVADVFNHNARDACTLLSEPEVSAAVYAFAEKGERDAIDERIAELLNRSQKAVWRRLQSGLESAVLRQEAILEAVGQHKLEMNQRYAAAMLAGEDGAVGGGPHEVSDGPLEAYRQEQQLMDMFEVVQPPPGPAQAAGSAENAREIPLTTLVNEAVGAGGAPPRTRAEMHRHAPPAADDELPGDGLERNTVDAIVANALQRAAPAPARAVRPASNKRSRTAAAGDAVDVDGDDDEISKEPLVPAGRATRSRGPQGRGGGRSRQTARPTAQTGGGSLAGMPTLQLTHDPAPNVGTAQPPRAPGDSAQTAGVLNLMTKWGSHPS